MRRERQEEVNAAPPSLIGSLIGLLKPSKEASDQPGLGTFVGVYTPTILTILGVIMYLRFGWVVGNVGLMGTLVIVVLANAITFATTLSFSAVATNTRVGIGGAYFIISRSLGVEIGGAIGLPLYLSQVFSVTLYAFGLAESLRIVWAGVPIQIVAFIIVAGVGALSFKGAQLALKIQLPILGLIAMSLLALAGGAFLNDDPGRMTALEPSGEVPFFAVFAVFFPAVTGVMAGLGLSGDLRDPQRAIPLGSISASLTGFGVYLLVPGLLALGASAVALREDPLIWTKIAILGPVLILPGLWGAIFSSAVGSMLGAPRTLQALAKDHLAPKRLGEVQGERQEPVFGLVVSLVLALGAIFLGDLNMVASVVTMFFLTVYGMVNLVAALETLSGDISWRPRIRPPWWFSMAGALACFAVMFLINPIAGIVAIALEIGLWLLIKRKERRADWGDARRDVYEALVRWALIKLKRQPVTARNWRPNVLVFSEDATRRIDLLRFGHWFGQGRGVVTSCEMVVGDLLDDDVRPRERRMELDAALDREGVIAFSEVNVVRSIEQGIIDIAQANGLAGFQSNLVMVGWRRDPAKLAEFLRVMKRLERLNKSVLIGRTQITSWLREGQRRNIHIWWGGLQRNGDMMLLLAHLLTRNPEWRGGRVTVNSIASTELMKRETEAALGKLLPKIRINADVKVLLKPKDKSIRELINEESYQADLVFLGLASPEEGEEETYAQRLIEMADNLPSFFLVKNASLFVGELVGYEHTPQQGVAAVSDKPVGL